MRLFIDEIAILRMANHFDEMENLSWLTLKIDKEKRENKFSSVFYIQEIFKSLLA